MRVTRPSTNPKEHTLPSHEQIYKQLRNAIMYGDLAPNKSVTLRGIAEQFGVSMTPAREALKKLSAEGALKSSTTGRYRTNALTSERIEELATLRSLLEPELASRALPRAHSALIERLISINTRIEQQISRGETHKYIQGNLEFHRALYLRAQSPAMLALVETIWLQLGPTVGALYNSLKRSPNIDMHRRVIGALKAGDEPGLRLAIRTDVSGALRMLMS